MSDDDALGRVARFRQAARIAVDSPADLRDRFLVLIDLADMARAEPDRLVARWSEIAIFEECRALLGMDDEALTVPGDMYERAQRRLRDAGVERCPTCLSTIATSDQLEKWSRLRRAEAERLAAREAAVES